MRILVTNDDGIQSPALGALVNVAQSRGADVVVAAPNREYSGASASLLGTEVDGRLVLDRASAPGVPRSVTSYAVHAAPAMIVFAASYGAFGPRPDLVLSGVNLGANTGRATVHSGTVGAALTASALGIRGMAVSVASATPHHLDTVEPLASQALEWLLERPESCNQVLNLNVPDLPAEQLRGMRQARLASFGAVQARVKEKGIGHVTLTYSGLGAGTEKGTDAYLLARGWATLTLINGLSSDPGAALPLVAGPAAADWVERPADDGARPDAPPGSPEPSHSEESDEPDEPDRPSGDHSASGYDDGELLGEVSTGAVMSGGHGTGD